jgi:next-to-BRCA1 protein 1
VQPDEHVVFERYSDSAGAYVVLDSDKPQIYKTLFRAAKAKLKLRLRATIPDEENEATLVAPIAIAHSHEATSQPPQLTSPASPAIAHSPVPTADAEAVAPLPRSYTARQSKSIRIRPDVGVGVCYLCTERSGGVTAT